MVFIFPTKDNTVVIGIKRAALISGISDSQIFKNEMRTFGVYQSVSRFFGNSKGLAQYNFLSSQPNKLEPHDKGKDSGKESRGVVQCFGNDSARDWTWLNCLAGTFFGFGALAVFFVSQQDEGKRDLGMDCLSLCFTACMWLVFAAKEVV